MTKQKQLTIDNFYYDKKQEYWCWSGDPFTRIYVKRCKHCNNKYIIEGEMLYALNGTYYKPKKCPYCFIETKYKFY